MFGLPTGRRPPWTNLNEIMPRRCKADNPGLKSRSRATKSPRISRRWEPPSVASDPVASGAAARPAGDAEDWRPVIQALAGIECHALDLPGHGRNQGCAGEWLRRGPSLAPRRAGHAGYHPLPAGGLFAGGGSRFITPACPRRARPCCWRTAIRACRKPSGPPASCTTSCGPAVSSTSL